MKVTPLHSYPSGLGACPVYSLFNSVRVANQSLALSLRHLWNLYSLGAMRTYGRWCLSHPRVNVPSENTKTVIAELNRAVLSAFLGPGLNHIMAGPQQSSGGREGAIALSHTLGIPLGTPGLGSTFLSE